MNCAHLYATQQSACNVPPDIRGVAGTLLYMSNDNRLGIKAHPVRHLPPPHDMSTLTPTELRQNKPEYAVAQTGLSNLKNRFIRANKPVHSAPTRWEQDIVSTRHASANRTSEATPWACRLVALRGTPAVYIFHGLPTTVCQ